MIQKGLFLKVKGCILLLLLLKLVSKTYGQIPVEMLVGQNQLQHEFFFFKDIDKAKKINLFSMARFAVDYDNETLNSSFISSQATYNFTENWGLSGGALYADKDFVPLVALSYSYFNEKGDLFINLFPTVLINENPEYEMFGLFFYSPKINESLSLFTQLIFGTTFNKNFSEHLFSYQQIRLGIGFNDWFQTGIGLDQNIFGANFEYSNNIGLFIRKEL